MGRTFLWEEAEHRRAEGTGGGGPREYGAGAQGGLSDTVRLEIWLTSGSQARGSRERQQPVPRPQGREVLRVLSGEPGPVLEQVMGRGSGPEWPSRVYLF